LSETERNSRAVALLALILGSLAILAANLFWFGPKIAESGGEALGNAVYLALRLAVVLGLGFALSYFLGQTRGAAMRTTTFILFFDQVVLKSVAILGSSGRPDDVSAGAVVFGLAASFVIMTPFVILFTFIAAEAGRALRSR
jgi:hypothetical protein